MCLVLVTKSECKLLYLLKSCNYTVVHVVGINRHNQAGSEHRKCIAASEWLWMSVG